jgi:monoamine oxidase
MPSLYTSLIARQNPKLKTLAPKEQRPPIPPKHLGKPLEELQVAVAEEHFPQFAEIVRLEAAAKSIAVIGAGLAGLTAAYELRKRGYSVSLFEASERPGGRTVTIRHIVKHHHMDGGAELIGSNHPLWLFYADLFHLGFSDVGEDDKSPVVVGTKHIPPGREGKLLAEMNKAFAFISARAKRIVDAYAPWTDPTAADLDGKNVHEFVMATDWPGLCKKAVLQLLESDNGVPAKDQSLLALLAMVKGGGLERYWLDTEVYRCKKGTQALSTMFATVLNKWNSAIRYKTPVRKIEVLGDGVRLYTDGGAPLPNVSAAAREATLVNNADDRFRFDDVILAIPPTAWSTIPDWLPVDLQTFVASPPQMGKNIKGLLAFDTRFWKARHSGPNATLTKSVDQTWETTEQLPKPQFGLVAFAGAKHAADLSELNDDDAKSAIVAGLEQGYKQISKKVRHFKFMNWPKEQWAQASYSFPKPGDITHWGPKFSEGFQGRLHFAGEHTCYAFTGYMEGALQSGFRLARKLVQRDGKPW